MKTLHTILTIIILAGLSGLISCYEDEDLDYIQLIPTQLRHLYLVDTTFVYEGEEVEFTDTLIFLHNKQDTIRMFVNTIISDSKNSIIDNGDRSVGGTSYLLFESAILKNAEAYSDYTLSLRGMNDERFWANTDKNHGMDTAKVLDFIYPKTYKYPKNNYPTLIEGFSRVYFALDDGFVLIETEDNHLFELIKN